MKVTKDNVKYIPSRMKNKLKKELRINAQDNQKHKQENQTI